MIECEEVVEVCSCPHTLNFSVTEGGRKLAVATFLRLVVDQLQLDRYQGPTRCGALRGW